MSPQRQLILFWFSAFVVLLALIYLFSGILLPFVLGMVIAYLLNPLVNKLGEHKISRGPAAFAIVIIFLALAIAAAGIIVPILCDEVIQLSRHIPEYYERLRAMVQPAAERIQDMLGARDPDAVKDMVSEQASTAAGMAGAIAGGLLQGGRAVLEILSLLVITPFVAYYMMKEWKRITGWIHDMIPRPSKDEISRLLDDIDGKLSGFIRGQALVALFLGTAYALALTVVGLQYGFLIGFAAGVLSLIPMVGSTTGFVVSLLVAWLQTGDWHFLVTVAAIFLAGQIIEGNFLTPKIVGDRVGLHPLWVFFALMAGASLFGLLGMLIAVPVAAVISVLMEFGIRRYKAGPFYKGTR